MRKTLWLGLFTLACVAEPVVQTPTQQFTLATLGLGDIEATGVAYDPDTGHLWFLVTGVGLVESTQDGQYVSSLPFGIQGLIDYGFTDLARMSDGSFALTANTEAYRYRASTGSLESYFCFEPEEEPIVHENHAIAMDEETSRIFVEPVYYDLSISADDPSGVSLDVYSAADGEFVSEIDVSSHGLLARGLAYDADLDVLWAVAHSSLNRVATDGTRVAEKTLDGVEDAQGIAVVGAHLYVLDGADQEIRVFDKDDT